jgi:putative heme-binding domain-containing protein
MHYLRQAYDREPQRRVEIALGLAQDPRGENWPYLIRSLSVVDSAAAREILVKLRSVSRAPTDAEAYRQTIITGLRLGDDGANDAVQLLEHWQGFPHTAETPPWDRALAAWQNWFAEKFPKQPPPKLTVATTPNKWNYDALLKHLRGEKIQQASAARGKAVFVKAQCDKCHRHGDVGESMGPDLSTVGKRFLTQEILDSIVHPSRVISDQYRAKTVVTAQGLSLTGLVGSGGNGDLLVLKSDGSKARVAANQVAETFPSKVSSMPEGLLNPLSLDEITDLFAFLQTTFPERVSRARN